LWDKYAIIFIDKWEIGDRENPATTVIINIYEELIFELTLIKRFFLRSLIILQIFEWIVMYNIIQTEGRQKVEEIMYNIGHQKTRGRLNSVDFVMQTTGKGNNINSW
jgi:hypothetical protein